MIKYIIYFARFYVLKAAKTSHSLMCPYFYLEMTGDAQTFRIPLQLYKQYKTRNFHSA